MQRLARHAKLTAVAVTLVALAALLPPPSTLWAQTLQVANAAADLTGKILMVANSTTPRTVSNLFTFDRSPSAPFAVTAASAKVTNLDADKLDGIDSVAFTRNDGAANTGGQIKFPATQVPSSDVNTLDDYEEGTFSPLIGGTGGQSGQTYTASEGRYVKIGRLVHVNGRIILSAVGTITGGVQIQALPIAGNTVTFTACAIPLWANTTATFGHIGGIITATTTTAIDVYGAKVPAVSTALLVQADLSATTQFIFSCDYEAAS